MHRLLEYSENIRVSDIRVSLVCNESTVASKKGTFTLL